MTIGALEKAIEEALEGLQAGSADALHLSADDFDDLQALFIVNGWTTEPLTAYRGLPLVKDDSIRQSSIAVRGTSVSFGVGRIEE